MGQIVAGFFIVIIFLFFSFNILKNSKNVFGSDNVYMSFMFLINWLIAFSFFYAEPIDEKIYFYYSLTFAFRTFFNTYLLIYVIKMSTPFNEIKKEYIRTFFIIPTITLVLSFINGKNGLLFSDIEIISLFPKKEIEFYYGIWFYVDLSFNFFANFGSILVLYKQFKSVSSIYSTYYIIHILSFIVIITFNIVSSFNLFELVDVGLIGSCISVVLIYWLITCYQKTDCILFSKELFFLKISSICLLIENDGTILESNPVANKFFSFLERDLKGENYNYVIKKLIKKYNGTFFVYDKEEVLELFIEETIHLKIFITSIYDKNRKIIGSLIEMRDVTKDQELIKKLSILANSDALTGLFNRRYFDEKCEELDIIENLPLTIVVGDLNNLKLTNDRYGHLIGDRLIALMGKILREAAPQNAIVAREGGDEFFVILPNTNEQRAKEYIDKIKYICDNHFEEPFGFPSIALGYDTKYSKDQDLKDVIKRADAIMYTIKREKKIRDKINEQINSNPILDNEYNS